MLVWFDLKVIVVMDLVMVLREKGGDERTMCGDTPPLWPLDAIFSNKILFLSN